MPDPRIIGLHELKSLIHQLNEANLRVSSAGAHLSLLPFNDDAVLQEMSDVKLTIEEDLLPRCIQLFQKLNGGGGLGN